MSPQEERKLIELMDHEAHRSDEYEVPLSTPRRHREPYFNFLARLILRLTVVWCAIWGLAALSHLGDPDVGVFVAGALVPAVLGVAVAWIVNVF